MKIRTESEFYDALDKETSWRKKELTSIKLNIASARNVSKQTALRSGITLLYAHWEGLVKNLTAYYLCYVSYQNLKYSELTHNFLAISIKKNLENFTESNKASLHNKILLNIKKKELEKSRIPFESIIKTNSNLNSQIFREIMETIGLDYSQYEINFNLLDEVLLKMRNDIAHGEKVEYIDLDGKRFDEIYGIITTMMNQLINQVSNAVSCEGYRRSG